MRSSSSSMSQTVPITGSGSSAARTCRFLGPSARAANTPVASSHHTCWARLEGQHVRGRECGRPPDPAVRVHRHGPGRIKLSRTAHRNGTSRPSPVLWAIRRAGFTLPDRLRGAHRQGITGRAGRGASAPSPAWAACPCPPRCARWSARRRWTTHRGPSSRRPGRRSARPCRG